MEQNMLQKFKQNLLEEKESLQERIKNMEETLNLSVQDTLSELSMYDNHPADVGDEMFERSKDMALRDQARFQLEKVDDALARMEEGKYGICEHCGREINVDRLEAMPSTTYCMECKAEEEQLPDRHIRPIEEDVIAPPFGMRTHDDSEFELGDAEDENEFDGEDTWQILGRYGSADSPQDVGGHAMSYNNLYPDFDEDVGTVENVDAIPYERNVDGMIYKDFGAEDDETVEDTLRNT